MSQLRSPAVPLESGTLVIPMPPEVSQQSAEIRYVLYRVPAGFFFDFVADDVKSLSEPVQAWLWARKKVLHFMMWQRIRGHLDGPMLPPEVDVH